MFKLGDRRLGSLFVNENDKKLFTKSIKIALIGYPNDEGVLRNGGRVGAAAGPEAVRNMLKKKGSVVNEEYAISLDDIEIKDFGDSSDSKDLKSVHKAHQELVQAALKEDYLPIVVGGGNDQSYPNFMGLLNHIKSTKASVQNHKVLVINIDAHLDVRPLLSNDEPHSGSPFRQILETDTGLLLDFVEFGCQGGQCSSEHVKYVHDKAGKIIWLKDLRGSITTSDQARVSVSNQFEEVLNSRAYDTSFVSFDIDSVRYSDCPGVSCPSPIGLTADEALSISYRSGRCSHVRLFDISEFNPAVESYMTATLVSNMIYFFIMGVVDRRLADKLNQ